MNTIHLNSLLSRLSRIISKKTALHFPEEKWKDLESKAIPVAKEFGFTNLEELTSYLEDNPLSPVQIEILAVHLTIGETYFWREPQVFDALEQKILPALIQSRLREKRLRIWSAGCATGEEPYSMAILLHRLIPDISKWDITILATDLNTRALRKARQGIYGMNSFRNAPPWLKEHYFTFLKEGIMEIVPFIRHMLNFAYLNLADDTYPSPSNKTNEVDMIFCRNVLMYFGEERQKQIVNSLCHSLAEDGWLIVSMTELSQNVFKQFSPVNLGGAIVYQKVQLKTCEPKAVLVKVVGRLSTELETPAHLPQKKIRAEAELLIPDRLDEFFTMIRALANEGKLEEAVALCEKVIGDYKLIPRLRYLLATILIEHKQTGKALESLKQAIYLDPDYIPAYYALGNAYLQHGDLSISKRTFEKALSLLSRYNRNEILPDFEGLTAGRLREIIHSSIKTRIVI